MDCIARMHCTPVAIQCNPSGALGLKRQRGTSLALGLVLSTRISPGMQDANLRGGVILIILLPMWAAGCVALEKCG
jgi:hypothetical protein